MRKLLLAIILLWIFFGSVLPIQAASNSYVSIVNPVRGQDFWTENFDIWQTTDKQIRLLEKNNLEATFLLRPDVFLDQTLVEKSKNLPSRFDKGIFLEITPSWADVAGVTYHSNANWHDAGSVFLSGYTLPERKLLIDIAFEKFKSQFGNYPKSVGAWWVDSYSMNYMYDKYQIQSVLIVADQYSTDNYQVWGQYFGYPYYPSKVNALFPAQDVDQKIPVVVMQWAARDPVNGYGKGVEESTLSVQANDYIDYHDLDTKYFRNLINSYLEQPLNKINQIVIGLENSYSYQKYGLEYENQIKALLDLQNKGQVRVVDMANFAAIYKTAIPRVSPEQVIFSSDPMGGNKKSVWFMNPYYRASWVWNGQVSLFRDVRQYIKDQRELCFDEACKSINFATSATRVMDQVTNGLSYQIDEGQVSDVGFNKIGNEYILSYINAAGKNRTIKFLNRDIVIDNKISTIDGLILDAQVSQKNLTKQRLGEINPNFGNNTFKLVTGVIKFLALILMAIMLPGLGWLSLLKLKLKIPSLIAISGGIGIVNLILVEYFLGRFWEGFLYVYILVGLVLGLNYLRQIKWQFDLDRKFVFMTLAVIILGTIYWCLPVWKSGQLTEYGLGFWGPNGHDGIWHLAVAESLRTGIPPQTPIFSGQTLKNYHYLFDVLLALSQKLTGIPFVDLLFRLFPILFGLLIGFGVWALTEVLFGSKKWLAILALSLTYFTGSFGWIVEYMRGRTLSGESAFWVNQPISINLNPPFALSLVVVLAIILVVYQYLHTRGKGLLLVIGVLGASLIGIKIYGFILLVGTLFILSLTQILRKQYSYGVMLVLIIVLGIGVLLPNYDFSANAWSNVATGTFIFMPWWFIHTMVDYSDRVGWLKLAQARVAYFERGEWFKFGLVELVGLGLFIGGNLGIRVIGLVSLINIKKIFASEMYRFIFLFVALSMLTPLFVIQTGTAWNTIQFFYYSLPFLSIATAFYLFKLAIKLPKVLGVGLVFVVVVLGSINSVERAISYFVGPPHTVIPFEEVEALQVLRNAEYGEVLTVPYEKSLKDRLDTPWPLLAYDSTAYVSAMSGKPVFMEDEMQNQILGNNYVKRRVAARDFFNSPNQDFLNKNDIKYIYMPKVYKISISADTIGFKQVFENNEVVIYKKL